MCLSCYAIKCGISEEELTKDAYSFLQYLNDKGRHENNPFTESDLKSALEMFQECYRTFPRADIEKISGIEIPKNKRNGRKQSTHLKMARAIQQIQDEENGTKWNGRLSAEKVVFAFLDMNPQGDYKQFCEDTGLQKSVYYKYKKAWKEKQQNLNK